MARLMSGGNSNLPSLRPAPWTERASCADESILPDTFYTEADWPIARSICARCPVRAQCFEEFKYDKYAFAGGTSPEERKELIKTGELPPPPPDPSERVEPTVEERAVALFQLGMSYRFISSRLGVSAEAVRRYCKAKGVESGPVPTRWNGRAMSTLARVALTGLYAGEDVQSIADRLNCHPSSVHNIKTKLYYGL